MSSSRTPSKGGASYATGSCCSRTPESSCPTVVASRHVVRSCWPRQRTASPDPYRLARPATWLGGRWYVTRRSGVVGHRRAGADQIAVAVRSVDATDGWPVLGRGIDPVGVGRLGQCVRMGPLLRQAPRRVRGVDERILLPGPIA